MPGRTKKSEQSEDTNMEDAPPSAQKADAMQEDEFAEEAGNGEEEEEEQVQRVRIVRPP